MGEEGLFRMVGKRRNRKQHNASGKRDDVVVDIGF